MSPRQRSVNRAGALHLKVDGFEALEGKVGAVGCDPDDLLPRRGRLGVATLAQAHIPEIQIRRHGPRVELDRGLEMR